MSAWPHEPDVVGVFLIQYLQGAQLARTRHRRCRHPRLHKATEEFTEEHPEHQIFRTSPSTRRPPRNVDSVADGPNSQDPAIKDIQEQVGRGPARRAGRSHDPQPETLRTLFPLRRGGSRAKFPLSSSATGRSPLSVWGPRWACRVGSGRSLGSDRYRGDRSPGGRRGWPRTPQRRAASGAQALAIAPAC